MSILDHALQRVAPTYVSSARESLQLARDDLLLQFGAARLEETAYPVYTNSLGPASYLGWSRISHAQRLLSDHRGDRALDFGAGLGVMLPFLSQRYGAVAAIDLDPEPTKAMVERMNLANVEVGSELPKAPHTFDLISALDVLEHVENLRDVYEAFLPVTAWRGRWVISGPTENVLYKLMRKVAHTTGEGHVRNIYDVFREVPAEMRPIASVRLPFGSPVPLFLVGVFERCP
jgi:2-polyprenyl-3-methyl-5-hydroxy-6-metoxy-1,4-benzoquinol methylase